MERLIFHVDVNSAFLSWEAARRVKEGLPDLRLIPSVVGGDPKTRVGIVTAKSIPAKAYGIVTGEPVSSALRKCPDLTIVRGDFALYRECSAAFKAICADFAPVMESFSIDEVFLDLSGTGYIYPDPVKAAHALKDRIREELGFTVNIGISVNKLLAKTASDFTKPDRVHTLFPDELETKFWPLPVEDLLFLGKSSAARCRSAGIRTIGDLARRPEAEIRLLLGEKNGAHLWRSANGIDDSPVSDKPQEAKGFSVETTFEQDIISLETAYPILLAQTDSVARRLRAEKKKAACVTVTWRNTDFVTKSHQTTLPQASDITDELYAVVRRLFTEGWKKDPLRLIGMGVSGLTEEETIQFSLFEDPEKREKKRKLDAALDQVKDRYGKTSIRRAGTMQIPGRGIGRKDETDRPK